MAQRLARRARAEITYAGKDISADLAPFLISVEFTDQAHGKADEIQIELDDARGDFKGGWMPEKGGSVVLRLVCEHWEAAGDGPTLKCGVFEVDEVELKGPPDVITIKAVSTSVTDSARRTKRTRAWEHADLKSIAGQIAGENKRGLLYDAEENPTYDRVDQRNESDLAFVKRLCEEGDLNFKVSSGKFVIFDGEQYDRKDAVDTVSRGALVSVGGCLISYSFKTQTGDTYSSCEASYWDPETKERIQVTVDADEVGDGDDEEIEDSDKKKQVLKLNRKFDSAAEAEKAAKAALRGRNKLETTGELTLLGAPLLVAGVNVQLAEFGRYSGRYAVEESRHRLDRSGGYVTTIKGRRI